MDNEKNANTEIKENKTKETEFDIFGFEKKPNFDLTKGDLVFSVLAVFACVFATVLVFSAASRLDIQYQSFCSFLFSEYTFSRMGK